MPNNTSFEYKGSKLEELKETSLDVVQLRRIFLMLTREHFSDADNYYRVEEMAPLIYHEEPAKRTLDIDLDYVYDFKEADKKPAIYVGTGPVQFAKQVLDNYETASEDGAVRYHTSRGSMQIGLSHIATEADVALQLGVQSLHFFAGIRHLLMGALPNILQYEVLQLTQPQLTDPAKIRNFQVDLQLSLLFNTDWATYLEGHRISDILFRNTEGKPWNPADV